MTESFVSSAVPCFESMPAAAAGNKHPLTGTEEMEQSNFEVPGGPLPQAPEYDLLPSFGVERARELLVWLINLELRLPAYGEISPA